jgi:DNA-binding NtrC family response regulator
MKISPPVIDEDALAALEAYGFPGNVRELKNILKPADTLSIGGEVRTNDIRLRPNTGGAYASANAPKWRRTGRPTRGH